MSALPDAITCSDCGEWSAEWDYGPRPAYDPTCLDCLAKSEAEWNFNPRADKGCWQFHQERGQ